MLTVNTKNGIATIPKKDIIYIECRGHIFYFHLNNNELVESSYLRVSFKEFTEQLLEDVRFVCPHQSYIVNLNYVSVLYPSFLEMKAGGTIPVSKVRRGQVRSAYVKNVSLKPHNVEAANMFSSLHKMELSFLKNLPLAFNIIRIDVDEYGEPYDFIFVYVNQALVELTNIPLEKLLGASFYDVFANGDKKWLNTYWETAYTGVTKEMIEYSPEIDKQLAVFCYQPIYGYCASLLRDASEAGVLTPHIFPLHMPNSR